MTVKSTIERLPASRVKATLTFEEAQVKPAEEAALQRLAERINVPGFRPGKAPPNIVREKIDPADLLEETARTLVPSSLDPLITEHTLQPILPPRIEIASKDPFTVHVFFVEHPTVTVGKIPAIEKKDHKVDDKDVQRFVDSILDRHKETKEVDRVAKEGDEVTMDFEGKDTEGKLIEGAAGKQYPIRIGSQTLIPGFEEQLKDLKKGDKKDFTVTFPATYHAEHLRNQPVTFSVAIHKVEEVTLPKLDDAFAKDKLQMESAQAFKDHVRKAMIEQEETMEKQRREQELFGAIRKATKVEIAPELQEAEERQIVDEISEQYRDQGRDLGKELKNEEFRKKFLEDLKARATDRLHLRFGVRKLLEDRNVQISDEEMDKAIQEFLKPLSGDERKQIEARYKKGEENYEQLKWQRRVEKLMADMLK